MRAGLAVLVLGYVLSQFYRAFLAVLAPALERDLGVSAGQLADASALWFLTFAAMQIPVGLALDRVGPRRTAAVLLGLGGAGGAAVFALAEGVWGLNAAMMLIAVGCSPVLMAAYYIFARTYPAAVFATLASAMIGIGSVGNLAAAWPLAFAAEALGWRGAMAGLALVTALVALALGRLLQDPPPVYPRAGGGSLLDLLRMPALWLILPVMFVNYAPAAGLRGFWAGPYFADVHGLDTAGIGTMTLVMGLAMVAGNFAYGPLDRVFGSRKAVILGGNLLTAGCLIALWAWPGAGPWAAAALLAGVGFFGATFGMVVAHGRSFVPPHLVGRGVTLLNLFGIGGVGLLQMAAGRVHAAAGPEPAAAFGAVFLTFALALLAGCAVYLFARDRTD